jgi:tRNA 2-thiouridine synthesizing protein A
MSDADSITVKQEVDASGLNCPLPILRAKKALTGLDAGDVLKVISTDPGSRRDFEAFARQTGHELVRMDEGDSNWTFFLKHK